jgi:hypothetical protein
LSSTADDAVSDTITGGKVWKPFLTSLNDAQLKEVEERLSLNQFAVDIDGQQKTFTRRKIRTRDYAELESLRAQLAAAKGVDRPKLQNEIYQKAAQFYLGMTAEEFDSCDYEEVKKIIDAQNIRTNYGVPNQKTS